MIALLIALLLHLPHGHGYGWYQHHTSPTCVVQIPGVNYWHGTVFCPVPPGHRLSS